MTFPTDAARATSLDGSFGTNHVINLPSGVVSGSLVVILTGFHDGAGTVGVPAGWTIYPVDGGDPEFSGANAITPDARVIYRVCDGTEGSTITVTTSLSRGASSVAWRVEGHDPAYPPELIWDTGTSGTSADPPFHDPHGWEGLDTLWLAGAVVRATSLSGTPTNYTNVAGSGPGGASVSARGASRQLNAVSENPSAFTTGAVQHYITCTIAIKPVDDETLDHSPLDVGAGIISRTTANQNSHTVRLPRDIQVDERIIVGFAFDAPAGQNASFPAGWNIFLGPSTSGPNTKVVYAYRDTDGTEGSTITVTTSGSSTSSAAWAKRIVDADLLVPPEGTVATGTSTTADPPTHSPSWGITAPTLFIASASMRVATTRFIGGTPANYEKVVESPSVRNVTNGTAIRAASRELTATSDNPGAFGGHTSTPWIAVTIAVKGGAPAFAFTADAVLFKTSQVAFTADAEIVNRTAVAFTADAILVVKVFEDNFGNRTTLGSLGTPSGTGTYASFTAGGEYEVNVSDGYLSTPPLKIAYINYSPSIDRGLLVFDFWTGADVDDTDPSYAGIGYEIAVEPRTDFQSLPLLTIGDVGLDTWEIKVGNDDPDTATLDRESWYRVKTWFDYEDTFYVKVWKPTDPEPADWQYSYTVEDTQATDFQVSHIFMGANEHGGPRIDNLSLFRASGTTYPKFTADAFFERPTPSAAFFANAVLVKGFVGTFTADASIAYKIEGSFTADAYFQVREHRWFTAQAWLHKPRPAVDVTNFTKRVSLAVAERRKRPDETYVPPRELDPEPDINIGRDGPCLPPCPPTSAGPGSPWGANGQAIRRAAYRCTACSDSIVYTPLPMMGLDSGSESGHDCCNTAHNKGYHVHRLWVKYLSMPTVMFNMKANLKWTTVNSLPNTVSIRVYANIPDLPNVSDGNCIPYDNDTWNGGDYVGNLLFVKHAGTSTTAFDTTPASLTLDPKQLSTGTFRFQCENEGIVIRPEFRASNAEIY